MSTTTKLNIGKIPISKGEYQEGTAYQRLNQVTMLGSTYQSKIDGNTSAPAQLASDGSVENINTDKWIVIAVGNVSTAKKVMYNNETSGLEAGNVQKAIDEVGSKLSDLNGELAKKANAEDVSAQMQTEQERVNAEFAKKFDKESILQELGDDESKVVSQKCVKTAFDETNSKIGKQSFVLEEKSTIPSNQINLKWDIQAKASDTLYCSFNSKADIPDGGLYVLVKFDDNTYKRVFVLTQYNKEYSYYNDSGKAIKEISIKDSTIYEEAQTFSGVLNVITEGSISDDIVVLSNSTDKVKTLLNSVEKDILGESILEYEVAVTGKYINSSGLEYSQSNSIITKPIQLYAGDRIKMIVDDTGFAIIAKPKVDGKYTPVYEYSGKNTLREYVVTEDMLVCFTVIEGSKITILNNDAISKKLTEINTKLDYSYDGVLRTERGKKSILSVSDIKSGDVVDVVLLPDYSYKISNYCADKSAISIYAYDKNSYTYGEILVQSLQFGNTAIVSVSEKVDAIIVTALTSNIKFDIDINNGIVNRVELVEDAVSPRSIKDNLQSDGSIKRIADCIKNGKADSDNYGKENTRYKLNVKSGFDKLYMYFEWRATSVIDTRNTNKPIVLFSALNGYARNYLLFEDLKTNNANLYRAVYCGRAPRGKYSYSNSFSIPSDNETTGKMGEKYHNFVGMDALWIRYTGSASSASMKLLQDGVEFTLGDNTEKVTTKSNDLLSEVCQKINAIQDIECSLINGADNKTYNDVFYENELSIPLKYNFTSSNGMTINDSPRIYIPLKYDEKWHSCEVLVDVSKKIMYVNHDGFTVVTDLTTYKNGSNTIDYSEGLNNAIKSDICEICIGEDYNEGNIPLVFRNLEIEVGSDGGAEIIEARCPIPNSTGVPFDKTGIIQMISNHNPRVVLYEGHGILVGNDKDFPASDNESFVSERSMSCTTGRLMRLFEYAKNKGYEFVSWQEVVDWKINGKTLPKRSMSLMFDDFRVENYLDYDKRIPFRKFNVKPALCLITSKERFPLDGTITVNDKVYTRKEAIEMCKTAGWYMTSHSHDHRNQDEIQPSAQIALLKADALTADEYNINSDIIVYGGANFRFYNLSAMKASSFSIGVNGMSQDYICKAINNFYINRVDIGLRLNWENVIAPLG